MGRELGVGAWIHFGFTLRAHQPTESREGNGFPGLTLQRVLAYLQARTITE